MIEPTRAQIINLKAILSRLNESETTEKKEFTMSNIDQMNLIAFYYHGYVPLHIISSYGFTATFAVLEKTKFGEFDNRSF